VSPQQRAAETYRWDRLRGAGQGVTETCWQVFALLVAIRVFEADESIKQFIPAGIGIGFLLSPLGLGLANRMRLPISSVIALLWLAVAVALLGMTLSTAIVPFVAFVIIAQVTASQGVPILTHLYSSNYPARERGSRLATTFVIASSVGIAFGYLGGKVLDWNVAFHPLIFTTGIAAALLSAYAVQRIPSEPAHTLQARNPVRGLAVAWQDRLFFRMLIAWMLMGMGNLMLIPIRVEYLANPAYGINASNAQISALLISTVLAFRLLSTKLWGHFFDRVNVIVLRVFLNSVFMASIACFFFTDRLWLMAVGCALLGAAFGGGGILWALYVTKIAPPDKVAAYMSVHSFTSGIRMALAPFVGYAVMQIAHPAMAAWIALLFIGVSTLIFLPLRGRIDALADHLEEPPPPRMGGINPA
jgi:hypothetical protein